VWDFDYSKSGILLLTQLVNTDVPVCRGYNTLYSCSLCLVSDVSNLSCVVECRSGGEFWAHIFHIKCELYHSCLLSYCRMGVVKISSALVQFLWVDLIYLFNL
jgi:hypothetical protein